MILHYRAFDHSVNLNLRWLVPQVIRSRRLYAAALDFQAIFTILAQSANGLPVANSFLPRIIYKILLKD